MAKPQEFYSVSEVAELEKLPYHKVIRLLKAEEFPNAYKVGHGWVIPASDVDGKKKKSKLIFKKKFIKTRYKR